MTRRLSHRHATLRPVVLARDGYVCQCGGCGRCVGTCPRRADQADHIVPRAAGGTDTLDNYRAMCGACNASLGATWGNRRRTRHSFFYSTPAPSPARLNLSPPVVDGSIETETEQRSDPAKLKQNKCAP